jgi:hypothetical protein
VDQRYSRCGDYPGIWIGNRYHSLLRSVGYDPDQQLLEVELQDGKIYQYTDIPEQTYRGLMGADSLGRYFNYNIRGHHYDRVR